MEHPPQEDLFEYTLDGLEPDQYDKVYKHLSMCKGCQAMITEYARVSEGLALTAPELEPPKGIEKGVMEKIRQDKAGVVPLESAAVPGLGGINAWAQFWMRLGPVFAVLALVMTGMAFLYMQKAASLRQGVQIAVLDQGKMHGLLSNQNVQTVNLKSANGKKCTGSITCAPGSKYLMVSIDQLEKCPLGRVYTVWMSDHQGGSRKLTSFVPKENTPDNFLVDLKHEMGSGEMDFKVTLQDKKMESPSGEIYLSGGTKI